MSNYKISFLLSTWNDAHQQSRIKGVAEVSTLGILFGYKRDDYKSLSNYSFINLGNLSNGRYLSRIKTLITSFFKIKKQIPGIEIIYVFGLENLVQMLLIKTLFHRKLKIIYEISDIREVLLADNIWGRFLRITEQICIRNIDLLVVTSKSYVEGYFNRFRNIEIQKKQIIINKILRELNISIMVLIDQNQHLMKLLTKC